MRMEKHAPTSQTIKEATMRSLVLTMLCSVVVVGLCFGQGPQDAWDNLKQLRVGQKIEVLDMNLKSVKGTFSSFSGKAISLQTKQDQVTVARADVLRVSDREHSKRLRNALLGGAIGAGIGLAAEEVGTRRAQPISKYRGEYRAIGLILVPIGAGAGVGLGAACPSFRTIYRAQKPRKGPAP
jgi:hypothetical protein